MRTLQWWRHDDGSVSIELLLVLPALFAVLFLGMQGALYYHARTVAIAAAQEGARAAAAEHASTADGAAAAGAYLAAAGRDVLLDPDVRTSRTTTTASVTVRGTAMSVLPGWRPLVTQSASAPVERLTSS
jgi:Flp pilus assembly protein TadG